MKKLFAFLFLSLFSISLQAAALQATSPSGDIVVTIVDTPCSTPAIAKTLKEIADQSFDAVVVFKGKQLKACWIPLIEDGKVGILDETGDAGAIPMSNFKEVPAL